MAPAGAIGVFGARTGRQAVTVDSIGAAGATPAAALKAAKAAEATHPSVSVVMPCLNEEETVGACVAKAVGWLERRGIPGEVLVVDNGSTDRSVEIAEDAGARVIHERRRGYGQAYLRGFAEARGDYIVMGDSDDTYDFSDLDALVAPLDRGADMVLGNRFAGGIANGAMPWAHRYIGSPIINFVIRLFFGTRIGDSQSGLRAFRRGVTERLGLRSSGMELASEMIVSASRAGLTIAEVPAPYAIRRGESKLNTVRDGWRHLRYLLLAAPDFLFTLPGAAFVVLGVLATRPLPRLAGGRCFRPSDVATGIRWHDPAGDRRERSPLRRNREALRRLAWPPARGPMGSPVPTLVPARGAAGSGRDPVRRRAHHGAPPVRRLDDERGRGQGARHGGAGADTDDRRGGARARRVPRRDGRFGRAARAPSSRSWIPCALPSSTTRSTRGSPAVPRGGSVRSGGGWPSATRCTSSAGSGGRGRRRSSVRG